MRSSARIEDGLSFKGQKAKIDLKVVLKTWKELPKHALLAARSALIGVWMGITPAGATPASFMSYGVARKMSKDPAGFGTGQDRGRHRPRDRGACRRHLRAAADAHPRRAGVADRGGAAGRADHVGAAARADAVRRAEGVRLGPDRLDVSRQHCRAAGGAGGGALVRRHPAGALPDHRRADPDGLRHRRLHGQQCRIRHRADADLRHRRLCA